MSGKNPFSLVYTALWTLAEAEPELTSLVALKNRIRYDVTDDRDPEKRTNTDADLPELVLTATGMSGNLWNTSTTSMVIKRYSWIISTGDFRITERLLPVEWALFKAMHGWKNILSTLVWQDMHFVKRVNLLDIQEGILRPEERRDGPRGWACVWEIEVEMHFNIGSLR